MEEPARSCSKANPRDDHSAVAYSGMVPVLEAAVAQEEVRGTPGARAAQQLTSTACSASSGRPLGRGLSPYSVFRCRKHRRLRLAALDLHEASALVSRTESISSRRESVESAGCESLAPARVVVGLSSASKNLIRHCSSLLSVVVYRVEVSRASAIRKQAKDRLRRINLRRDDRGAFTRSGRSRRPIRERELLRLPHLQRARPPLIRHGRRTIPAFAGR